MRKHNNRHISSDELLEFAEMGDKDFVQQQINKLKRKNNKRAKNRVKKYRQNYR